MSSQPTPAKAYELGVKHAALLRSLYNHPDFKYQEPPTAEVAKFDLGATPEGLFFVTDFVQNTYVNYVLPRLPQGASRKCNELGNPSGSGPGTKEGKTVEFPRLPLSRARSIASDLVSRTFLTKKLILEGQNDPQLAPMLRGQDFGDEVKAAVRALD
ncbi:hypothetical protein F5Y17DRAFT_463007 [Xylariaceae sp. FL0594]|nr:hypothetical protein F5Y17DRAFT_463007 [Xylariaceae sp. FL0594]